MAVHSLIHQDMYHVFFCAILNSHLQGTCRGLLPTFLWHFICLVIDAELIMSFSAFIVNSGFSDLNLPSEIVSLSGDGGPILAWCSR